MIKILIHLGPYVIMLKNEKTIKSNFRLMRILIYLFFLLPFLTIGQINLVGTNGQPWSVDTGAETVVAYATTTSSLGLVEDNESEALNNANKLIAGINAHPEGIDIDGVYYIQTPSTKLTSSDIRLSSVNGGELKSNESITTLFNIKDIENIEVGGVTFSDVYSGGGDLRLFYYYPLSSTSSGIIKFNSSTFNGNIYIYYKNPGKTTDPSTYKIGSFIFRNNTITNNRKAPIKMNDFPIDVCEIVNNYTHNFDGVIYGIGASNDHTYESDIYALRPLFTYTDNYTHNDVDWECEGSLGSYLTTCIFEAHQVDYLRNHTEGIWTTLTEKAVYDSYLSCNIVNYKNNVNKNNVKFDNGSNDEMNTLIKMKGAADDYVLPVRNVEDNHFIVEESWIDEVVLEGANKAYGYVYFAQTGVERENPVATYIKNNVFDIYNFRGRKTFEAHATNYEVSGNTFNLDFSNNIYTETLPMTDANVPKSIVFSNNTFNVLNTNQQDFMPAMVRVTDLRTTNTDKIGSIAFNNNTGTLKNHMVFGQHDTAHFEMTDNDLQLYPDATSVPYFSYQSYNGESNISNNEITFNSNNYFIGTNEYSPIYNIDENITFYGTPSLAYGRIMVLAKGEPSVPDTTYRRTYNVNDGEEIFYFDFTLSYNTDHWEVSFIDSGDTPRTFRANNNDGETDGNGTFVKVVNSGTNNTATQIRFANNNGTSELGFNQIFNANTSVKLNIDTYNKNVDQSTGSARANAGSDVSICSGESTTLTASGGLTYSWSTGATTNSITVSPNSTQTYTVTVSDSNGNSDSDDVIVTVNSVTANAGSDVTIDEGDSITLTASGGNSYLWNTGATTSSITVSPLSTQNYTVTASSNGCDDTDTVRVNVNATTGSVTANAGSDVSICEGENTKLTASGGSNYSWSTGATTSSITVSPNSTQTYTVTVSDSNGNSDTDDVLVTVNSVNANAGSDVIINEGDSVTLTASGGNSYLWNTGATTSSITVSPLSTQTYSVSITQNGCEATDEVKVTVNPNTGSVTANAGPDMSICSGESITLTASGGSTYLWNTGATTNSIRVSPNSTQTYIVTASDSNGNSDSDDVNVTVNSVTANAGSDRTIIEGETITLVATGGDTYIWNTGEKTNSINVSPNSTMTYSVTAYKGSCYDIDDVEVVVEPTIDTGPLPAQADAGEDMTICLGETIVLNGSGGETYQWSNGETSSSISVSPNRTTSYELTATRGGVSNTDSVTITVENCENQIISDEKDMAILEMAVYPNPTKGKLTILINNLDEDANFIINDTNGSLIYSDYITGEKTQFEKQINLSRYNDGLYFVRLYTAEQYLVKKVMVQ
ncbi:T9SS type A sorting domain-containing protein [Lutimonas vermicola]|uniref:T9SS type A sorting domain-containing protein n=1 Tax=Lutimonas vermicola TaxID=414288 RepID=A0ABU9L423_9FLAO